MVTKKIVLPDEAVEDRCPKCGIMDEEHFDYGDIGWRSEDSELPEESMYQQVRCMECGLDFKQWYEVKFVGQQVTLNAKH